MGVLWNSTACEGVEETHHLTDVKMSVIIIANNNDYTSAQVAMAA